MMSTLSWILLFLVHFYYWSNSETIPCDSRLSTWCMCDSSISGEPCVLNVSCDGDGECPAWDELGCRDGDQCTINCNGDFACAYADALCPSGAACLLTCTQLTSCETISVFIHEPSAYQCTNVTGGVCPDIILSFAPTRATSAPSSPPSDAPSSAPSTSPSSASRGPSTPPSSAPTSVPSRVPNVSPSPAPSIGTSSTPTNAPSASPSLEASLEPKEQGTVFEWIAYNYRTNAALTLILCIVFICCIGICWVSTCVWCCMRARVQLNQISLTIKRDTSPVPDNDAFATPASMVCVELPEIPHANTIDDQKTGERSFTGRGSLVTSMKEDQIPYLPQDTVDPDETQSVQPGLNEQITTSNSEAMYQKMADAQETKGMEPGLKGMISLSAGSDGMYEKLEDVPETEGMDPDHHLKRVDSSASSMSDGMYEKSKSIEDDGVSTDKLYGNATAKAADDVPNDSGQVEVSQ